MARFPRVACLGDPYLFARDAHVKIRYSVPVPCADWKPADPLFRGDSSSGVETPSPKGPNNITRHIMYFEGAGRETPYLSTTEDIDTARFFAHSDGKVWRTAVATARPHRVTHIPKKELLGLLKGKGKGKAAGHSAIVVAQARRYVEEWAEHLLDFTAIENSEEAARIVSVVFTAGNGR